MKKTGFRLICMVFALLMSIVIFSACDSENDQVSSLHFKTLTVGENNSVYGKVPNGTSTFSFLNEIDVSGTASYGVYLDIICSQEVKSKTVSLTDGDNTFYILVENNGNDDVLYTVTVRVRPLYEVIFDTNGGTDVEKQIIEEDACAEKPTTVPTKDGYIFSSWAFDFSTPITGATTISANWNANQYTLTVIGNGGTSSTKTIKCGETIDVTNISKRDGYKIGGIYRDIDMSVELTTMPAENTTAYVHWVEENKAGDFSYTTSANGVTITGYNSSSSAVSIPLQIGGKDVIRIDHSAFKNCTSITSITIPDSVTSIGEYAFDRCTNLNAVYITDIAKWCNISFVGYCANPLYYADNLYLDGELVTNLEIPNGVMSIGHYAFRGCTSLKSVTIPDSVTSIGNSAFSGCAGLKSVTIPGSVTSIGDSAFSSCTNLNAVYITDIAKWCNISFSNYLSNPFADILNCVGNLYLDGELVTNLEIPNGVTSIGNYAFYNCRSLTSITIPESVTSIGGNAFYGCHGLTSVTIPGSVTSIGGMFSECGRLTSVTIGDGATSIRPYAFQYCWNLTSITIPNSVTSIGDSALSCSKLTDIYFNGTVEEWNAIEKTLYWGYACTITCTNGKISKDGTVTMM